jgi:hypothetical protein
MIEFINIRGYGSHARNAGSPVSQKLKGGVLTLFVVDAYVSSRSDAQCLIELTLAMAPAKHHFTEGQAGCQIQVVLQRPRDRSAGIIEMHACTSATSAQL